MDEIGHRRTPKSLRWHWRVSISTLLCRLLSEHGYNTSGDRSGLFFGDSGRNDELIGSNNEWNPKPLSSFRCTETKFLCLAGLRLIASQVFSRILTKIWENSTHLDWLPGFRDSTLFWASFLLVHSPYWKESMLPSLATTRRMRWFVSRLEWYM